MPSEWMNRLFADESNSGAATVAADIETHASARPSPASASSASAAGPVPASTVSLVPDSQSPASPAPASSGPEVTSTGRKWSKRAPPGSSPADSVAAAPAAAPGTASDQPAKANPQVMGYRSNAERAVFDAAEHFCPDEQLVVVLYHTTGKRKGKVYKSVPLAEYIEAMGTLGTPG